MKQNSKTKKTLYSLFAAGVILGTSLTSGCVSNGQACTNDNHMATQIFTGILVGLGQGLSAL